MQTHISQSLPKDLEDKIKEFRETVKKIHEKSDYPLEFICNMDETPLFLDCVPRKVIDRKGKKTIHVRTTGSQKNRITVTCCSASGKFLPPFVVFKGKIMRPLKNVTVPDGVVATTQQKAWMDESRMLQWIRKVWAPYTNGKPALLSLDTFSAPITDTVKVEFEKFNTKLLIIPGGCTSILQPLDITFKDYVRQLWCQFMVDMCEMSEGRIKPASKSVLLDWVIKCAKSVESKPNTVKRSFEVGGIVPSHVRNDQVWKEIQNVMKDVFGDVHMGYVSDDHSNGSSDEAEDPFVSDSNAESDCEDPFASEDESSTELNS